MVVPSLAIAFYLVMQPGQQLIENYQLTRILAWLNPEKYADAEAYQQLNSVMAIGSGQLWGKGLNNNVIASVKNGNFISEPGRGDRLPELYEYRGNHNDYAEYRNSASLCQQRYDVSAESVYRNGIRTERSITEKKFILV